MKYEKLNKIPAKRTIWPENTVVDFEAYEAPIADEAIDELVNWYTEAKNLSEKLTKELSDTKDVLAKTIQEKAKEVSDATTEAIQNKAEVDKLAWKNKELENQLNEAKKSLNETNARMITIQTDFNAMSNRIDRGVERYNKLMGENSQLLKENNDLKQELENIKNSYSGLEVQYNTALNQLDEVEKTMSGISDLINFYKEWKKKS